jgi:hypothetical protein
MKATKSHDGDENLRRYRLARITGQSQSGVERKLAEWVTV